MINCDYIQTNDKVRRISNGELLIVTEVFGRGVAAYNPETGEEYDFIGVRKLERTK